MMKRLWRQLFSKSALISLYYTISYLLILKISTAAINQLIRWYKNLDVYAYIHIRLLLMGIVGRLISFVNNSQTLALLLRKIDIMWGPWIACLLLQQIAETRRWVASSILFYLFYARAPRWISRESCQDNDNSHIKKVLTSFLNKSFKLFTGNCVLFTGNCVYY